jgi:predicted nucleic acid-binding protein
VSYLLDTNVISEIRRQRDPGVRTWASTVPDSALYLSVLTLGEIRKGIERLRPRDPHRADAFATWLTELGARFADHVIPIDIEIAHQWGRLNAASPRNTVDCLIAATALVRDLTVVTRNTPDFEGCGLRLLNPWETPPES